MGNQIEQVAGKVRGQKRIHCRSEPESHQNHRVANDHQHDEARASSRASKGQHHQHCSVCTRDSAEGEG